MLANHGYPRESILALEKILLIFANRLFEEGTANLILVSVFRTILVVELHILVLGRSSSSKVVSGSKVASGSK